MAQSSPLMLPNDDVLEVTLDPVGEAGHNGRAGEGSSNFDISLALEVRLNTENDLGELGSESSDALENGSVSTESSSALSPSRRLYEMLFEKIPTISSTQSAKRGMSCRV